MMSKRLQRVLLVGGGAREHAIGEALCRGGDTQLLVVSNNDNPGLAKLAQGDDFFKHHDEKDVEFIVRWAKDKAVDFAVIGLEDPLEVGLPDKLAEKVSRLWALLRKLLCLKYRSYSFVV